MRRGSFTGVSVHTLLDLHNVFEWWSHKLLVRTHLTEWINLYPISLIWCAVYIQKSLYRCILFMQANFLHCISLASAFRNCSWSHICSWNIWYPQKDCDAYDEEWHQMHWGTRLFLVMFPVACGSLTPTFRRKLRPDTLEIISSSYRHFARVFTRLFLDCPTPLLNGRSNMLLLDANSRTKLIYKFPTVLGLYSFILLTLRYEV